MVNLATFLKLLASQRQLALSGSFICSKIWRKREKLGDLPYLSLFQFSLSFFVSGTSNLFGERDHEREVFVSTAIEWWCTVLCGNFASLAFVYYQYDDIHCYRNNILSLLDYNLLMIEFCVYNRRRNVDPSNYFQCIQEMQSTTNPFHSIWSLNADTQICSTMELVYLFIEIWVGTLVVLQIFSYRFHLTAKIRY